MKRKVRFALAGLFAVFGFLLHVRASPKQKEQSVCAQFGSAFVPPDPDSKVGVALATLRQYPLNALRHPSERNTCGWYIWGGEVLSQDADFFQPLHVHHLVEYCPAILPYLALAPGWRVLLARGQIEVWYDPGLLKV